MEGKIKHGGILQPRVNACRFYTCWQILRRANPSVIYAVEARERERGRSEEKKDRGSGWKRGEKKEGEGGIGRWAKKRRIVKKRKKKASMDREVLTRALTELSSREIKKKYAWMDGGFSTFIKKKSV